MQDRLVAMGITPRYLPQPKVWHWVPKERCSQNWVLQRGYRYSVQCGLDGRARDGRRVPLHLGLRLGKWAAFHAASRALCDEKLSSRRVFA